MSRGNGFNVSESQPIQPSVSDGPQRTAIPPLPYAPGTAPPPAPRRRSAWRWILFLLILLVVAWLIYFFWASIGAIFSGGSKAAKGPNPADRPAPVDATEVRRGSMDLFLTGLGTVTPLNTVVVRTRVDGQLDRVSFVEGQNVHEGDLLVQIDPRPFEVQLTTANGQMARDQALLANAQTTLARDQAAGQAVSALQLDNDKAAVAQAEGNVKVDQASIDNANLQLTYAHITAPIGGRIGLRNVDAGNIVHAGDSTGLATIAQMQPIGVTFSLAQDVIPRVLSRMQPAVRIPFAFLMPTAVKDVLEQPLLPVLAYDRNMNYTATGNLMAIDSQIDPTTGTVRLKAVFANKNDELFPNQYVNARLLIDVRTNVLLIPTAAVQHDADGKSFVYVVQPPTNEVQQTYITEGPTEAQMTLVEHGLQEGQTVVTNGIDKLTQGKKVILRGQNGPATRQGPGLPGAQTGGGPPGGVGGGQGAQKRAPAGNYGRPAAQE